MRRAVTVFQTNVAIKAAAPAVSIELREDRTGRWYRFRDRAAPAPGKVRFCSNSGTGFATATLDAGQCPLWVKADMATLNGDVRFTPEIGHQAAGLRNLDRLIYARDQRRGGAQKNSHLLRVPERFAPLGVITLRSVMAVTKEYVCAGLVCCWSLRGLWLRLVRTIRARQIYYTRAEWESERCPTDRWSNNPKRTCAPRPPRMYRWAKASRKAALRRGHPTSARNDAR